MISISLHPGSRQGSLNVRYASRMNGCPQERLGAWWGPGLNVTLTASGVMAIKWLKCSKTAQRSKKTVDN